MHRTPPVNHHYSRLVWQLEKPPKKLLEALNLLLRRDEPEQHRQCCIFIYCKRCSVQLGFL